MKDKYVIFVAGIPASGKTRFAKFLASELRIPFMCKDIIKEKLWDRVHYDTTKREESTMYGTLAYDLSYYFVEELMKGNTSFIFESNFNKAASDILKSLVEKYDYYPLTILFDANIEVLHKRFLDRDIFPERHFGLRSNGHFSDFDIFKNATESLKDFSIGITIKFDTTDFSKVCYSKIMEQINELLIGRLS